MASRELLTPKRLGTVGYLVLNFRRSQSLSIILKVVYARARAHARTHARTHTHTHFVFVCVIKARIVRDNDITFGLFQYSNN